MNTFKNDFIYFIFLVGLGFELKASLLEQALYHLSHTSSPFCSGVLRTICWAGLQPQSS
jgi:hypothetical protein